MQLAADQAVAIVEMVEQDWSAVRAIYLEGIATGDAIFESPLLIGKRGIRAIFNLAD